MSFDLFSSDPSEFYHEIFTKWVEVTLFSLMINDVSYPGRAILLL